MPPQNLKLVCGAVCDLALDGDDLHCGAHLRFHGGAGADEESQVHDIGQHRTPRSVVPPIIN